jgi:hypothetical protein
LSYSVTALAIYIETVAMESVSLTYAFDPLVGGDAVVLVALSLLSLWMKKYGCPVSTTVCQLRA